MNKVYTRINWENYPSENTALNESNLNKMDSALNEIDTRVVEHETTKANVESLNELINYWHIDETTGVITIHKVSGEQIIFDLNLEKVPVGFSMTDDGILIMTTDDGTEFTANIGSMIPVLTFNDSEQIAVAVSGEGVNKSYTFTIKTGSITEDKLQPNFLADCRLYAGNAENSANLAEEYAEQAKQSAETISNKKKYIFLADSYGMRITPSWIDYFIEYLGLSDDDYYKSAVSGTAFSRSHASFINNLTNLAASIDAPGSITDIILCGGWNDANDVFNSVTSVTNVEATMATFIEYCKNTFPNAMVHIGYIGHQNEYYYNPNMCDTASDVLEVYKKCVKYGGRYLNNVQYIMHDMTLIDESYFHPNALGMEALGRGIAQAYLSGSVEVTKRVKLTVTGASTVKAIKALIYQEINNAWCNFFLLGQLNSFPVQVSMNAATNFTAYAHTVIATFDPDKAIFLGSLSLQVPVNVQVQLNGGTMAYKQATLCMDRGNIYISFNETVSGVTAMIIQSAALSFRTMSAR